MITLGSALKRLRRASGLTQRQLASQLDIAPSYLSHLESGRKEPSVQLLRQFAHVMTIPTGLLLALTMWVDLPFEDRERYEPIIEKLLEVAAGTQLRLGLDGHPARS